MSERSQARGFRSAELRLAFQAALDAGWTWKHSKGGHVLLYAPDGKTTVALSSTAGNNGRAIANALAQLKRAGLEI